MTRRDLLDGIVTSGASLAVATVGTGFQFSVLLPPEPRVHRLQPERMPAEGGIYLVPAHRWPFFEVQFGPRAGWDPEQPLPKGTSAWNDCWRVERLEVDAARLSLTMAPAFDPRRARRLLTLPRPLAVYRSSVYRGQDREESGYSYIALESRDQLPSRPEAFGKPAGVAWVTRTLKGIALPDETLPEAWRAWGGPHGERSIGRD